MQNNQMRVLFDGPVERHDDVLIGWIVADVGQILGQRFTCHSEHIAMQ